jgi:predicted RNA-binding Zn-ribbon protein involved in translation (DUF1610 family)
MVIDCPHCDGPVGEESCVGCRLVIPAYVCSNCKGVVWNPRYKSGVECPSCGCQVVEHIQKSMRHQISHYICHRCGAVAPNPKFKSYSSCVNCNRKCDVCGDYVACDQHNEVCKCIGCGKDYPA